MLTCAGLGLELTRQRLAQGHVVVATCRTPDTACDLLQLQEQFSDRLKIYQLDTTDEESIQQARVAVERDFGGIGLHSLLNVSGILHDADMKPETSYTKLTKENLRKSFETNAWGPILVCKAFLPMLETAGRALMAYDTAVDGTTGGGATPENWDPRAGYTGAMKGTTPVVASTPGEVKPAVIANLSARVSSISDNRLGGWYAYRSSKAALNQLTRTLSLELARKKTNVSAILVHPGTCDTQLSLPYQKNVPQRQLFSKERGAAQILDIVNGITMDDNGSFFAWDGSKIDW